MPLGMQLRQFRTHWHEFPELFLCYYQHLTPTAFNADFVSRNANITDQIRDRIPY